MSTNFRIALALLTAAAALPLPGSPSPRSGEPAKPTRPAGTPTRARPLDVNTASEAELAALPGVGTEGARRIVDARPFASVSELSRTGLSKETLGQIGPLVKVTGAGGPSTPMGAADRPMNPAPPPRAVVPPHRGMVWGDPDSRTYRLSSDPASGRTEHGRWMTESEAIQAGYRKSGKE